MERKREMNLNLFRVVLVLVLTVMVSHVQARKIVVDGNQESLPSQKYGYVEGEAWKEIDVKIPSYPDDGDLMELRLDAANQNRFTYYMDEESLSVSEKDYAVRYTLVIESKRGTRNVFYEGMRCNTLEYKTYAFGTGKGKFRPSKKPEWKSMLDSGYKKLRMDLMEFYLCDDRRLPRSKEAIITRVKYPAPNERYRDVYNR
jgi:uncharacterized protein YxeA